MSTFIFSRAPLSPTAKTFCLKRYSDATLLSLADLDSEGKGLFTPYAVRHVRNLTVGEITAALSSLRGSVLHKNFFGEETPSEQISVVLLLGDGPSWIYRIGRGRFFACLGEEPSSSTILLQGDNASIFPAEPQKKQ